MTLKTDLYQVGVSLSATNNFTFSTDGAGGMKLARGNPGATTQDIFAVDSAGYVLSEQTQALTDSSKKVVNTAWAQSLLATGPRTLVNGLPVSTASGALADASANAYFRRVGRFVQFDLQAIIVNNGTGSSAFRVVMPWLSARVSISCGRENAVQGFMLQGIIGTNTDLMTIFKYDGSYPGGNGHVLHLSGWYEATT
jgi:hypothetical protein